jgi:hypothetical protein
MVGRSKEEIMQPNTADNLFGKSIRFLVAVGVVAYFGYLIYLILGWLFFGAGVGLLLFGIFAGLIYVTCGLLPDMISRRTGRTKWEAEKSIRLFLLLAVGIVLGFHSIPKQFNLSSLAWYWRVLLGIAVGLVALLTRRF